MSKSQLSFNSFTPKILEQRYSKSTFNSRDMRLVSKLLTIDMRSVDLFLHSLDSLIGKCLVFEH